MKVRVYNNLFSVPEPSERWEEELNTTSEVVHKSAIIDPSVVEMCDVKNVDKWKSNCAFQFERNVSKKCEVTPKFLNKYFNYELIFFVIGLLCC